MSETEVNGKIYDHRVLPHWSNVKNETNGSIHYSPDMIFNAGHRLSITGYSILFVLSLIGNSTVLYLLTKRRLSSRHTSRIDIMLMHLAIADLTVTLLLMPLEVAWSYTVEWKSTDFMCRLMSFFRVFGLYLSSFVLVCISVDRYFAIIKPLKMSTNRGRLMLLIAWCTSIICSLPQALLFHLGEHPNVKNYYQCVMFDALSQFQSIFYNMTTMCAMYACPLITFIYCYGAIYLKIYRESKRMSKGVERFRRSNDDVLCRAKKRTLKMTITIVIVFIICWTPYYIICMFYWFDYNTASRFSPLLRKALYLFACTNSCMNPIVYGMFNIRGRRDNNANSSSNRNPSVYQRGDSSSQIPKSLLNLSHSESNKLPPTRSSTNDKLVDSPLAKLNKADTLPMICISCGDSIELTNLQKSCNTNSSGK
uniref:G-protein coupled receptors family 1 profile domain-containing protein n=1 Tax=Glossina austeni TaxID=7395 RepID=A0A1A9UXM5_GLOAU